MKKYQFSNKFKSVTCILACAALAMTMASPAWAKDKLPEVTKDGLHLLKHTKVRAAYAKPGLDLTQYSSVKILDCYVQFKKNWKRDHNQDEVGLSNRVTVSDMDKIKKRLAAEFNKVFTKVLTKAGHPVVDEAGAGVLLLRPAIINLDVTAPDTMHSGFERSYVASAGEMTLYLELYDSATEELLARVMDPEAAGMGGFAMVADRVSNTAEADRVIEHWAKLLSKHLGDVKQSASAP